jgi:NADPH-dependent ferric siderophore reductase
VGGPGLTGFTWLGRDHWFRLFLPPAPDAALQLPDVHGRTWWRAYQAIPEDVRPHCSNYTVAGFRPGPDGGELDIDVVLHRHDDASGQDAAGLEASGHGELGGAVARWAASARPGSAVGLLDQGVLFDPPADASEFHLACDETGWPGVRGILASLAEHATGTALIEVPTPQDVTAVAAPAGVDVRWLPRAAGDGRTPGVLALAALRQATPRPDAYAYVVGESGLATGGRRALRRAGLPASRITFSGFWKA